MSLAYAPVRPIRLPQDTQAGESIVESAARARESVSPRRDPTLPAGTYQLRLSGGGDAPTIEFVQKGQVRASTLAIVPPEKAKFPAGTHAQRVRNDNDPYVRVTISRGGQYYLAYLPAAR